MMNKGVSIVICCYNSSLLLPQTLKHLSLMRVPENIPYEIILVDNASSDNTSEIARRLISENNITAPFKILHQPLQGLSYARKMGIENAKYEYILFCDDDNWLNDNYVELSFKVMEDNAEVGALGGESEAVIEGIRPEWFNKFEQSYSVGRQSEIAGDITREAGLLWGAGMVIRKSAFDELSSSGFRSLLSDRKGGLLTSGGDSELCYALRLAGWKIWYEPRLKFRHYIPRERLEWKYLRKLNRAFGAQKVNFDPYVLALTTESGKQNWQSETVRLFKKIRGYGFKKLIRFNASSEGDPVILSIEKSVGRLTELLKIRGKYDERINSIKNAAWKKTDLNVLLFF